MEHLEITGQGVVDEQVLDPMADMPELAAPVWPTIVTGTDPAPAHAGTWVDGLHPDTYHNDRTALNNSGIKKGIITGEHFAAYWQTIRSSLSGIDDETTARRVGTLLHMAVLEQDLYAARVRVHPEFGDLRKTDNKAAKKEWLTTLAPDHIVVKPDEDNLVQAMSRSILKHKIARALLTGGTAESTGYFVDPDTGLLCRIRPDFRNDRGAIVDLKTTMDGNPITFPRTVTNNLYDVQGWLYTHGAGIIDKRPPPQFVIIAVEKFAPYAVSVHVLDPGMLNRARDGIKNVRRGALTAMREIAKAIPDQSFTGYGEQAHLCQSPAWHFDREALNGI